MRLMGFRSSTAVGIALAFSAFLSTASATTIGQLSEANCAGGGVIVSATSLDWTLPTGGPDGCIVTGIGTNVNYGSGVLLPATFGRILDLPATPPGLPLAGFMTFNSGPGATNPGLFFDLTALGPGSASLTCAAPIGSSCSTFAGSPFILTRTATGTSVALSAVGNIRVNATAVGTWSGAYTTQLPGRTPEQVIANINSGGSETSTQSGAFITTIPEPGTISLSLIGGLLVAFAVKRRTQA